MQGTLINPIPLTSIKPEISEGQNINISLFFLKQIVLSSAISVAPLSISLRAKSDFPDPEGPKIIIPLSAMATAEP